jgi:positive regulator of sigma E activity
MKMSLQGKVTAVEDGFATVEVEPRPECKGCHACTGLLDGEKRSAKKQIRAKTDNFKVSIGDEVILDLHPGEGTVAAILIFGLPIAGFIIGMSLTPWFCQLIGSQISDFWRLIAGFAGMTAAFVLVAIAARTRQAEKLSLKVVQVIMPESQKPSQNTEV